MFGIRVFFFKFANRIVNRKDMLLIADSGSTKTQWAIAGQGKPTEEFSSGGLNPSLMSDAEFTDAVRAALAESGESDFDGIFFYGAGCTPSRAVKVRAILADLTGCGNVEVGSDMLGAARGLCGNSEGVVGILGTGSNSCRYNGREIVANTPPLGYVLGDEGSGARLGISLVNGILKGYLPEDLQRVFYESTGLDKDEIIRRVYREPAANRFLASFTRFIAETIARPEIESLVTEEFSRFFSNNITRAYGSIPVIHFVGSIAEVFKPQLMAAASIHHLKVGKVVSRPLPLIVDYHLQTSFNCC